MRRPRTAVLLAVLGLLLPATSSASSETNYTVDLTLDEVGRELNVHLVYNPENVADDRPAGRMRVVVTLISAHPISTSTGTKTTDLRADGNYVLGATFPVTLLAPGHFTATVVLEFQIDGVVVGGGPQQFWWITDADGARLVDHEEFMRTAIRTQASTVVRNANLEPGDVPGQGIPSPVDPPVRCGPGQFCAQAVRR